MTLARFKKQLKISALIAFFAIYGATFYLLGKSNSITEIIKVKGASTKQVLDTPVESPVPYSDTQSAKVSSSFVKLCSNTVYGIEISYPKDWFTTYNSEEEKCTFFAPYSFVVPYETSTFLVPIKVKIINPAQWVDTVKYYENPNDYFNVNSSENLEINGKSVKKIELTSTGGGLVERGFKNTTYLIFDQRIPTIISYQQLEKDEDVKKSKEVLDEIVNSAKYF